MEVKLIHRFNERGLDLVSDAVPDIILAFCSLDEILMCPLTITSAPGGSLEKTTPRGIKGCHIMSTAAQRLFALVTRVDKKRFGNKIARIP